MVKLSVELPEGFLEEEVRCEHVVTKEMKQLWAVEIDLLKKLLDVCKENDIRVFVSSGTLLGAVRHGGMIPWDDDIDVQILRDDYEKLCKIADKCFEYPYFFQTEYNDIGSIRGHAQLRNSETTCILKPELEGKFKFNQGVFIDIFPLDYVPDDAELRKEHRVNIRKYREKAIHYAYFGSRYYARNEFLFKKIVRKVLYCTTKGLMQKLELHYYKKLEKECSKYLHQTNYLSAISYMDNPISPLEDYRDVLEMPFEFITVPVSTNYDNILRTTYGDYRKYVKGICIHGGMIFRTDISYKEFLHLR